MDQRGTAGLEFTLVVPLMMIFLFGAVEAVQLVGAHSRVENAADALVNIVAKQSTGVTPALLTDICVAAQRTLLPYKATSLAVAIVSVTNYSGTVLVDWQDDTACPTAATAVSSTTAIADAELFYNSYSRVSQSGDSIIIAFATYTYAPIITYVLGGPIKMTHTAYARSRSNTTIPCTGC